MHSPMVLQPQISKTIEEEISVTEIIDDGWHPSWFGSRKAMCLMFVCISVVMVTTGTLFRNGVRVRRFQKVQNRSVHMKM